MVFDDPIQQKSNEQAHLGRNIQRIREIIGMKQSALAGTAGMSQQNVSKLEQSAVIPEDTLERLAQGLGVNPEFIKNFNEEKAVYNIQSNFTVTEYGSNSLQYQPTIHNDIDKLVVLFERLLQGEKEKGALLSKTNQALEALLKETRKQQKKQ